jgi:hypothetical protein
MQRYMNPFVSANGPTETLAARLAVMQRRARWPKWDSLNSPGVSAGMEAPMTRRECRPLLQPFPSVVTVADNSDRSIQQTCLAHALGNPFGVRWILEWQTIHVIFK